MCPIECVSEHRTSHECISSLGTLEFQLFLIRAIELNTETHAIKFPFLSNYNVAIRPVVFEFDRYRNHKQDKYEWCKFAIVITYPICGVYHRRASLRQSNNLGTLREGSQRKRDVEIRNKLKVPRINKERA